MENTKDEAFSKFLEKIQGQNKADLALQVLQVKYDREMTGEDNDKREEQLKEVASILSKIEKSLTGFNVKIDFEPVTNALDNQTEILKKSLEEQALLRKTSEGSLEYDKESAQYRNTSGREIKSDISGKDIKKGGYVDFETAGNRLAGQGKRVRESESNQIKLTPIEKGTKTTVLGIPGSVEPKPKDKPEDKKTIGFGNLGDLGKAIGARVKGIFDFMTNKVEKKQDGDLDSKVEAKSSTNTNTDTSNTSNTNTDTSNTSNKVEAKSSTNTNTDTSNTSNTSNKVEAKPSLGVTGVNPESDNVQSAQEILADSAKKDVELTKENNNLLEQQLRELKKISASLAPQTSSDLPEGRLKETPGSAAAEESGGGGIGLGDALSAMGSMGKKAGRAVLGGAKAVGKAGLRLGTSALKFASSGTSKLLGSAAAVGIGAYTAYEGYTAAEDSKQAKMADIQTKIASGEINEKQGAELRQQAGNTATVEKSGAVGEGTGMAAGAIAGAAIGTMMLPGIGTIAGGALGAFAGSKAGKYTGEKVGEGINAVKGFFGMGKEEEVGAKTKEALTGTKSTESTDTKIASVKEAKQQAGDAALKAVQDALANGADPQQVSKLEDIGQAAAKKFSTLQGGIISVQSAESIGMKTAAQAIKAAAHKRDKAGDGTYSQGKDKEVEGATPVEIVAGGKRQAPDIEAKDYGDAYDKARAGGASVKEAKQLAQDTRVAKRDSRAMNAPVSPAETKLSKKDDGSISSVETVTGKKVVQDVEAKDYGDAYDKARAGGASVKEAKQLAQDTRVSKKDLQAAEAKNASVSPADVVPKKMDISTSPSATVGQTSVENADMARKSQQPSSIQPIVSSNVNNNNTTSYVPIKPSPRMERSGSALDRYNDRVAVF